MTRTCAVWPSEPIYGIPMPFLMHGWRKMTVMMRRTMMMRFMSGWKTITPFPNFGIWKSLIVKPSAKSCGKFTDTDTSWILKVTRSPKKWVACITTFSSLKGNGSMRANVLPPRPESVVLNPAVNTRCPRN